VKIGCIGAHVDYPHWIGGGADEIWIKCWRI